MFQVEAYTRFVPRTPLNGKTPHEWVVVWIGTRIRHRHLQNIEHGNTNLYITSLWIMINIYVLKNNLWSQI